MLTLGDDQIGHEVDAPSRHDGPSDPVVHGGFRLSLCGKSGVLKLHRGAAAWVAADDGPYPVDRPRTDQDIPGHRGPVIRAGDDAEAQRC